MPMGQAQYSSNVQQRPLTTASQHDHQHTELAGTTAKRPAAPLVRDEEATVPVACPIGRSTPGTRGHSRTPITASDLGMDWLTRCVKHTSKQRVAGSNPAGRASHVRALRVLSNPVGAGEPAGSRSTVAVRRQGSDGGHNAVLVSGHPSDIAWVTGHDGDLAIGR